MGQCLLNSHISDNTQRAVWFLGPERTPTPHLIQLQFSWSWTVYKTSLTHSLTGYSNLVLCVFVRVHACACVCISFLLHGEESVGGWIFHHIRSRRDSACGQMRCKGRVLAVKPSMWPLSAALPTINRFGNLSGSDLSSFLVQGQVFYWIQSGCFFFNFLFFFKHYCAFLSHAQMAAVVWRLKTVAYDPKSTNSMKLSHKDFSSPMTADGLLVSVLQLEPIGMRTGRQKRIRRKCSRTAACVAHEIYSASAAAVPAYIRTSPDLFPTLGGAVLFLFIHFNSCFSNLSSSASF